MGSRSTVIIMRAKEEVKVEYIYSVVLSSVGLKVLRVMFAHQVYLQLTRFFLTIIGHIRIAWALVTTVILDGLLLEQVDITEEV